MKYYYRPTRFPHEIPVVGKWIMEYRVSDEPDVNSVNTDKCHNYEIHDSLERYTPFLTARKKSKVMREPYVTQVVRALGHEMGEDFVPRETMTFRKTVIAYTTYWTGAVFKDSEMPYGLVHELREAVDLVFMARKERKLYNRGYMTAALKGWGVKVV